MTDATVPVPVDLLKKLRDRYHGELRIDPDGLLARVTALIPVPSKVGDVLTAEQIADLPNASVMRDEDGDVLVKVGDTVRRITTDLQYWDEATRWPADDFDELAADYSVTLVSLPDDRD